MKKNSAELVLPASSRMEKLFGGRRRRFYVALLIGIVLALAVLFTAWWVLERRIESVKPAIEFLKQEVTQRDQQIAEIKGFKENISALLERKLVVEHLQAERGVALSILNFFVEKTPFGVALTDLQREGRTLLVRGISRAAIRERGSTVQREEDGHWVERSAGFMQSPLMELVRNMEAQQDLFASVELLETRNIDGVQKSAVPPVDAQSFTLRVMLLSSAERQDDGNSRRGTGSGGPGSKDSEPTQTTSTLGAGDEMTIIVSGLFVFAMAVGIATWWRRRLNLKLAREGAAAVRLSVLDRLDLTMQAVDNRDITSWPGALRAFVVLELMVITLLCGHWLLIDPQIVALDATLAEETKLREDLYYKTMQAVNLDMYRKQLAEADLAFGLLLRQLPNRIEANALMELLANLAVNQGLSGPQLSPGKEKSFEYYAEFPVRISASGSFAQIGRFLARISQLDRIATVRDFSLRAESGGLSIDANVLAYRMADAEERAAQRKAAKGKKK